MERASITLVTLDAAISVLDKVIAEGRDEP
jgi:hypothetical protein